MYIHRMRTAMLLATAVSTTGCATVSRTVRGTESVAPQSFVRLAAESDVQRTVAVRSGLSQTTAFRTAVDYLTSKGYTIEARDQSGGFVMTGWQATLARDGVPDLRYRTRLLLKFIGDDWAQLQLRAEANWRNGDEWQMGVDRALMSEIASELESRLGRRSGS